MAGLLILEKFFVKTGPPIVHTAYFKTLTNFGGQSLVEYLILICLIAVGTTAVVKVVGQNIAAQFNNVSLHLRGETNANTTLEKASSKDLRKKDFNDFLSR